MKRPSYSAAPLWAGTVPAIIAALGILICTGWARAQSSDVVKVEEDWELVLTQPDAATVAPQVTCAMSPTNNLDDTYWTFEVNHLTAPSFSAGGLHMHQWRGEWRQSTLSRNDRAVLTTANETVAWTQSLRTNAGRLTFEVRNGTSQTWGEFGYGSYELSTSWSAPHLNGYSPETSVANAGVGFAANRVNSLKLKRVRVTYADGQTISDNTERVVFQQQ